MGKANNRAGAGVLAGVVLAVAAAGCGNTEPSVGRVSGTVSYRGEPVTGGVIEFHMPDNGVGVTGDLDPSGRFAFDAPIPTGEYVVCVLPGWDTPDAPKKRKPRVSTPARAAHVTTSGMKATVAEGENQVTIEVRD